MSSRDGTTEGACRSSSSKRASIRLNCSGSSEAFSFSASRSRSPISSQIARQWSLSRCTCKGFPVGIARHRTGSSPNPEQVWLTYCSGENLVKRLNNRSSPLIRALSLLEPQLPLTIRVFKPHRTRPAPNNGLLLRAKGGGGTRICSERHFSDC